MHFLLLFSIFGVILQSSSGVEPGDPFPLDPSKSKILTSEDLINSNEILDLTTVGTTSSTPVTLLTNPSHEENSLPEIKTTSTKITPVTDVYKKIDQEEKYSEENSIPSIIKSSFISKLDNNNIDNNITPDEKQSSTQESSTVLSTQTFTTVSSTPELLTSPASSTSKSISKNNLIKIGQWRYRDPTTNKTRYWYEPQGGQMGAGWIFDRFIFQAYNKPEDNAEPVYAFHSERKGVWTNILQMDPQPPTIGDNEWVPDGVSFYAYKKPMDSNELRPVIRYWSKVHESIKSTNETRLSYLAMNVTNNENINLSDWMYDSIVFYALPIED